MIVDRRVAVLQPNKIRDNDNLEMMAQLRGTKARLRCAADVPSGPSSTRCTTWC